MIEPTVGRIVHYQRGSIGPLAAIITKVHHDRLVNATVFHADGTPGAVESVPLIQPEDEAPAAGAHVRWMPYQVKKQTGSESGEQAAGTQAI